MVKSQPRNCKWKQVCWEDNQKRWRTGTGGPVISRAGRGGSTSWKTSCLIVAGRKKKKKAVPSRFFCLHLNTTFPTFSNEKKNCAAAVGMYTGKLADNQDVQPCKHKHWVAEVEAQKWLNGCRQAAFATCSRAFWKNFEAKRNECFNSVKSASWLHPLLFQHVSISAPAGYREQGLPQDVWGEWLSSSSAWPFSTMLQKKYKKSIPIKYSENPVWSPAATSVRTNWQRERFWVRRRVASQRGVESAVSRKHPDAPRWLAGKQDTSQTRRTEAD